MRQGLCELIVVLDRSSSMANIKKDMEGGFNAFIEEQKKLPGECRVTLHKFDTDFETEYEEKDLAAVSALELEPRGGTALYDAVARAVEMAGARFKKTDEAMRPEKVAVLVITDGQENSSTKTTAAQLKHVISHQRDIYKWQFSYLGADESAFTEAQAIGVMNAASYTPSPLGAKVMFRETARAFLNYRSGAVATMDVHSTTDKDEAP